jgi:hypothetical protein
MEGAGTIVPTDTAFKNSLPHFPYHNRQLILPVPSENSPESKKIGDDA